MAVSRSSFEATDRWRRLASLAVLIVASLATIATTASEASLEAKASGQVDVGAGATVERPLVIRLEMPDGPEPGSGRLEVNATTVDGTHGAAVEGLAISVLDEGGAALAPQADPTWFQGDLPLSACTPSCTSTYRLVFTSTDPTAAATTVGYQVDVRFGFPGAYGTIPGTLTLELADQAGVSGQSIAAVAAALGLLFGVLSGRFLARRPRVRYIPGIALVAVLMAAAVSSLATPTSIDAPFWDTVWLVALAIGLARALYRWWRGDPDEVAIAGHAIVLIGGILFLGTVGLLPGYRLVLLVPASFAIGWLVGVVDAQGVAIRTSAGRLRFWPTTIAVVSQAIIVVGLIGYAVVASISGPWSSAMVMNATWLIVPALIAAVLVAVGLRRWFAGRGAVMGILDTLLFVIGGIGLLGMNATYFQSPAFLDLWGPAAVVSLGACVCGVIVAFRPPPRRARPEPPALPSIDDVASPA